MCFAGLCIYGPVGKDEEFNLYFPVAFGFSFKLWMAAGCALSLPGSQEPCLLCLGLQRIFRVSHSSSIGDPTRVVLLDRLRVLYSQLLDAGGRDPAYESPPVAAGGGLTSPEAGEREEEGRQRSEQSKAAEEGKGKSTAGGTHPGEKVVKLEATSKKKAKLPAPLKPEVLATYTKSTEASTTSQAAAGEEETSSVEESEEEASKKDDVEADFIEVKLEPSPEGREEKELEEVKEKKKKRRAKESSKKKEKKKHKGEEKGTGKKEKSGQKEGKEGKGKERKKRDHSESSHSITLVPRSPSRPPPGYFERSSSSYPKPSSRVSPKRTWGPEDKIPSWRSNPHLGNKEEHREFRSKGIRRRERWQDIREYGPSAERKAWFEAQRGSRWRGHY